MELEVMYLHIGKINIQQRVVWTITACAAVQLADDGAGHLAKGNINVSGCGLIKINQRIAVRQAAWFRNASSTVSHVGISMKCEQTEQHISTRM